MAKSPQPKTKAKAKPTAASAVKKPAAPKAKSPAKSVSAAKKPAAKKVSAPAKKPAAAAKPAAKPVVTAKVAAPRPAASKAKQGQQPKWVSDFIGYAQENPGMALVGGVAVLLALLLIFG